ncbi:MAG: DUF5615 family PIN-like protein [Myxococcota bacterium]
MLRPADLRFLTDENIAPAVVEDLRARGCDVVRAAERGLRGRADAEVLAAAAGEARAVLTQDTEFGGLALVRGVPCHGIVLIRPGDLTAPEAIRLLRAFLTTDVELPAPFVVVLEPHGMRIRALG